MKKICAICKKESDKLQLETMFKHSDRDILRTLLFCPKCHKKYKKNEILVNFVKKSE